MDAVPTAPQSCPSTMTGAATAPASPACATRRGMRPPRPRRCRAGRERWCAAPARAPSHPRSPSARPRGSGRRRACATRPGRSRGRGRRSAATSAASASRWRAISPATSDSTSSAAVLPRDGGRDPAQRALLLEPRAQGELEAFVRKGEAGDRQQVAVQVARRVEQERRDAPAPVRDHRDPRRRRIDVDEPAVGTHPAIVVGQPVGDASSGRPSTAARLRARRGRRPPAMRRMCAAPCPSLVVRSSQAWEALGRPGHPGHSRGCRSEIRRRSRRRCRRR